MTLSVCMIVKNEADVLGDCLKDASGFADELVIVDTGSTDETKKIASGYTDKVFEFAWCDDFAAARNFSYEKATCDFIMWLDADDRITPENAEKIIKWKNRMSIEDPGTVKMVIAGYDRPENGGVFFYPRIIRRDSDIEWEGILHEHLTVRKGCKPLRSGEIVTADFSVLHGKKGKPNYERNIKIMEKIPEEELHRSFWLCANCYLDCVMVGDHQRAGRYLIAAEQSTTPFEDRLKDYALINSVLKFHRKYDEMMKWNAMYLRCKQK